MTNRDRAQLAVLKAADFAGEGLVGAAVVAARAALVARGIDNAVVEVVLAKIQATLNEAIREHTAPRVTAPGLVGDLRDG